MGTSTKFRTWPVRAAAVAAIVFGVATIGAGGDVLFGDGAKAAGNVVGFVLWFNFLAGFAYVAAGGPFEARTVWAMTLRSVLWISIAVSAFKAAKRESWTLPSIRPAASDNTCVATDSKR